jgi:hypothetical protein
VDSFTWGKKFTFPDFAVFRHAVYLPIFTPRAKDGCENALTAIGNIPDPGATRVLIDLLDHKDPQFARSVLKTLKERLPAPGLEKNKFHEHRLWLIRTSWQKAFGPAVRKFARKLLQEKDDASLHDGAFLLRCLGEQEDLPQLLRGLDTAIKEAKQTSLEDSAAWELWHAGLAMLQRGVALPLPPRSPGERLLFVQAIKEFPEYRPPNWLSIYAGLLQDEVPSIRRTALKCLPTTPRNSLGILVPRLLLDADVEVQTAACWAARSLKTLDVQESLLKVLATARDENLFYSAHTAGCEVLPRLKLLQVLVHRLDEEGMSHLCLYYLSRVIKESSNINAVAGMKPHEASVCKQAWQQFLKDRETELARGGTYHFDDPNIPIRVLFPNVTFWRDKGK